MSTLPCGIIGRFVVGIGSRQAWPFLGLGDDRPTRTRERRLAIDALAESTTEGDVPLRAAAAALNGETITEAGEDGNGTLRLVTASGSVLVVRGSRRLVLGEPTAETAGEAWRFADRPGQGRGAGEQGGPG